MNFDDLRRRYSEDELSTFPGDRELRYRAFAPILSDLYEDKIVYYERILCVAKLKDIELTDQGFSATVSPLYPIDRPSGFMPPMPEHEWNFRGSWDWMRLVNHSINVPYAGWAIWPERERVRKVETLVADGRAKEALALTLHEPDVEVDGQ